MLPAGGTENDYYVDLYKGFTLVQSNIASRSAGYTFTGLPEDDYYRVVLQDNAGCKSASTYNATITSPGSVVAITSSSFQIPETYGEPDGSVSVSAAGGVGNYTYTLQPASSGQVLVSGNSATFTGVGEGAYTIMAKDANGCEATSSLYLPNPLKIELQQQDNVRCYGEATGRLAINEALGGLGSYTYQWYDAEGEIEGATSLELANRPAGTYRVEVKDRNGQDGCLSASAEYVLTENDPVTFGLQIEDVKCYGGTTGAIKVNPQGGTGAGYKVWLYTDAGGLLHERRSDIGDACLFSDLRPAYYVLKLEDGAGCTATDARVLVDSVKAPLLLSLQGSADPLGYGRTDGYITVDATGGTAPYMYTLATDTGRIGQNDHGLFSGLGKGIYEVMLHDDHGCAESLQVVLNQPDPVIIKWKSRKDVNCKTTASGSLEAYKATGGVGNFTYRWYKQEGEAWTILPSETDTVLNNVIAGTYRIEAIDANANTASATDTLLEPEFVTYVSESMPVHCYGGADGVIEAVAAGGMEQTYRFSLSPRSAVTGNEGTVAIIVSGEDTARFTGLRPGKYLLDLEDHVGCPVHLEEDDKIIVVDSVAAPLKWTDYRYHDPLAYGRSDGLISVTAGGGSAPYVLTFPGRPLAESLQAGEQYVADSLYEGSYHLMITDRNYHVAAASGILADKAGCIDTLTVRLVMPPKLEVGIEQLTGIPCKGMYTGGLQAIGSGGIVHPGKNYNYEWYQYTVNGRQFLASGSSIEQLPAGTYTVKITDSNGIIAWADNFVITEPEVLLVTTQAQATVCGQDDGVAIATAEGGVMPYTYEWSSGHQTRQAGSLSPGRYMVTVRDVNNCTSSTFAVVSGADRSLYVEKEQLIHPTCYKYEDGSIGLQMQGGTPPYRYLWNTGDTLAVVPGLPQGVYRAQIFDAEGCKLDMTYELLHPERLTVNAGADRAICEGSEVAINAVGSRAISQYNWYYDGMAYDNRETVTANREGVYHVSVSDEAGCRADTSVAVRFSNKEVTVNFSINGNAVMRDPLQLVNTSWPDPDSTRWILPENKIALLENNGHAARLHFLASGTFELGMLSYKDECYKSAYKTVTVLSDLAVRIEQLSGISCKGMRTGSLQAVGSGGVLLPVEGYSYEWYQRTGAGLQWIASGSVVGQLATGTYTVKIMDAERIVVWAGDFVLTEPDVLSVTTQVQDAVCGQDDGAATAVVTGGTMPYIYEWSSGHQTRQAGSLGAGRYMVLVNDANNCESKAFAVVAGKERLHLEEQLVHPTCYNDDNGSINLQLQGGTPPYRYLWNSGDTSTMLTGLSQGMHHVQVFDAAGCSLEMTYELLHPERLMVDAGADRTICKGQQATISAVASRAIKEYNWYHNGVPYDNLADITIDQEGLYRVRVFDEAGCRADTSITVNFLDVDIAADFLISGVAALNETVYAVNISWPAPDSIRWVLPGNNVTLLETGEHSAQLHFLTTGTFEVGMLSYKQGCYEAIYKTVEVVDEKDAAVADIAPGTGLKSAGVYPNPSSGYFNVKIELEKEVPVTLKLFTMEGVLLKTEQLQGSVFHQHLFAVPGGIMPGIYFLQIITPDSVHLTKVLIY